MLNETPNFTRMKQLATNDHTDVLLIEGFKEEPGPKVVLVKEKSDWKELKQLQDIKLVVGSPELNTSYPLIASREDVEQLDTWLLNWLKGD